MNPQSKNLYLMATIYKKHNELLTENKRLRVCLLKIKEDLELADRVKPCFDFLKSSIKANTLILEKYVKTKQGTPSKRAN